MRRGGASRSSLRSWLARALGAQSRVLSLGVALLCGAVAPVARSGRWYLHRGRALERLGRTAAAARSYRRAVRRADRRPEWFVRLGELYERGDDPASAAEVFRQATAAFPDRSELHVRCGEASARAGDLPGAVRAYERAAGLMSPARSGDLPRRLADLYDRVGRWRAAREVLEVQLAAHPDDGQGLRHLARTAERIWRWGGSFEGDHTRPEAADFRPLTLIAERDDEPLQVARRAMERAVALEPGRWAWRGALGELREASGDLAGAIECYAAMFEREASSNRAAAFRAVHRWEFALERARHLAGLPRVDDPLFSAAIDLAPQEGTTPEAPPVGCFDAHWTFGGLGVRGFVTSCETRRVEVLVDDVVLRRVNVDEGTFFPQFGQAVDRRVLEHFPSEARLRVRTEQGDDLLARGRGHALRIKMPTGSGRLREVLEASGGLDKKGTLTPDAAETRRRQEAYLRLYGRARAAFDRELDRPLFVIHGTLLGLHREGALIPGDDDFDVAYLSSGATPSQVKEEAKQCIAALVRAGFTVSVNRSGRLFRLHGSEPEDPSVHLDVHPMWFEDGRVWLHNDVCLPASVADFLPVRHAQLGGVEVYAPRCPEVFLEGHYGPGWKVPDPGFVSHRSTVPQPVLEHLARAFITPAEYRELEAELGREARSRPDMGRFVSIGLQPLYPLDAFVP